MSTRMIGLVLLLSVGVLLGRLPSQAISPPTDPLRTVEIGLRSLACTARVLLVTAHPDDENNGLIAWLARGLGAEVTLYTLTRGEGGQNEIGTELYEALGVLRMEELRASRRFDGAHQLLGRYYEFGYSFSEEETFLRFGAEQLEQDLIRVIRRVKPHVIFTMPRTTTGGGRHHQASAQATERAFHRAADASDEPELGAAHATARLFEQVWNPPVEIRETLFRAPLERFDPVLGATYEEFGFVARSFHKCQGTGQVRPFHTGPALSFYSPVAYRGEAPTLQDGFFGGLTEDGSTDLPLIPAPSEFRLRVERLRALPSIERLGLALQDGKDSLPYEGLVPLRVTAVASRETMTPGTEISVRALIRSLALGETLRVRISVEERSTGSDRSVRMLHEGDLLPGSTLPLEYMSTMAAGREAWSAVKLKRTADRSIARYDVWEEHLPELWALRLLVEVLVDGDYYRVLEVPVESRGIDARSRSEAVRTVALVPRTEVRFEHPLIPVPWSDGDEMGAQPATLAMLLTHVDGGDERPLHVRLRRDDRSEPITEQVFLGVQERRRLVATFAMPLTRHGEDETFRVEAFWKATDGGFVQACSLQVIDYPHIRRTRLLVPAEARIRRFALKPPSDTRIGWVHGTGDEVSSTLGILGLAITDITDEDLLSGDLSAWSTIILSVRAYHARDVLRASQERLREWMENGGHLIVFYNKTSEFNSGVMGRGGSPFPPYTARISDSRITAESGPVQFPQPMHRLLNFPNSIGESDLQGWVQERATYMLETKSHEYQDLILLDEPAMIVANQGLRGGALVTANVGKGRWTYVGLTLFRQVPEGVPGATKLLINLLDWRPEAR